MQNVKVRQYKNADNTVNLSAVPITNNIKRQQPRYDSDPLYYGSGGYDIGGSEYRIGGNAEYIIGGNGEYQRPLRGKFGTRARRMDDVRDIPHSRNDSEGGLVYRDATQYNERYRYEQDDPNYDASALREPDYDQENLQYTGHGFFDSLVDTFGDITGTRVLTDLGKKVLGGSEYSDLEDRITRIEQLLQIEHKKPKTARKRKGGEIADKRLLGTTESSKPPRQQRLSANDIF